MFSLALRLNEQNEINCKNIIIFIIIWFSNRNKEKKKTIDHFHTKMIETKNEFWAETRWLSKRTRISFDSFTSIERWKKKKKRPTKVQKRNIESFHKYRHYRIGSENIIIFCLSRLATLVSFLYLFSLWSERARVSTLVVRLPVDRACFQWTRLSLTTCVDRSRSLWLCVRFSRWFLIHNLFFRLFSDL